ncbi:hypothetical protein FHS18_004891 [Paenibacillus phyllosphaerae]|uniref:Uncharacterized protein n=1 Tax=Paenibacillus phyllosphaerae TaxID=274593 RepID=A0A7W5B1M1_9BACL|nr:hypothetical protein [Paenibacillus phyllosphaerae]MBB3112789.1 hypothetical protein [Paenibacillus phyllosphaerae]
MNKRPVSGSDRFGSLNGRHRMTGHKRGEAVAQDIYIGPSEDGGDKEYIKVVSGKISVRKPSFAQ